MIDDRIVKGCWDIITYDRVEEACKEMDMLESVITDIASGDSIAVLDDDLQKISRYIRRPDFLSCGCRDEKYEDMLSEGPIENKELPELEIHTRLTLLNSTDKVLRISDIDSILAYFANNSNSLGEYDASIRGYFEDIVSREEYNIK